jgi:hypothetical protein
MFARDPRHLQFEADVNRLFLYTRFANILRKSCSAFTLLSLCSFQYGHHYISLYEALLLLPCEWWRTEISTLALGILCAWILSSFRLPICVFDSYYFILVVHN